MKALAYTNAHPINQFDLKLQDVVEPQLRDSDLLVEVRAISINPGEVFIREHQSAPPGGRLILGWEFAGVVLKAGSSTKGFTAGDRVFGTGDMTRDGSWAERVAVDYRVVAQAPKSLSFTESASLPIGSLTAWESLFRDSDQLPPNTNTVLVIGGAGGVGSMAIQLLKARTSARVIATASRPESQQWCKKMGADWVVDHSKDIRQQLTDADIQNVDFIFSTHATQKNIGSLAQIVRPYGHIAAIDAVGTLDVSALFTRSISFHYEMVFSKILNNYKVESVAQILQTAAELADRKKLQPIANEQPLRGLTSETMKKAHELVGRGNTVGKIVLEL